MLYFAFGSNLEPVQMRERCPTHRVVGLAALHDHKLVFPLFSQRWGGGVASVVHAHSQTVWGALFELEESDVTSLDGYEGFKGAGNQHNVYDREWVTVELMRPDDDSVPRRVLAWTYIARPSNPSPPSRRYLGAILAGARHHRLPAEYVDRLEKIDAMDEKTLPDTS